MSGSKVITTVGEILVEFVSHRRDCALETISNYSGPYPSGAPAIFLDQAARMGSATEMIGGVGEDGFGRSVLARLKRDGVGTNGVQRSNEKATGVAFVSYYQNGTRDFIFHLADTAADKFVIPDAFATSDTLLHISAASLGAPSMRGKIMQAVRSVVSAGGRITCDPNARPELMHNVATRDALHEVMDHCFCLLPSTSDLGFLFPDLSEDAAIDRLIGAGADIVTVKRGAGGASVFGHGEVHHFNGHHVEEVDPTGAGDCFCGTFVSLVEQGLPLKEAGLRANAAGAIAVTRRGPMEGNSTPEEIDAFLRSSIS